MPFWLFNPSSLISSKNVLVYKHSNFEELMNFFTILLVSFAIIFKNKLSDEMWRKVFIVSFLLIFTMGVLLHMASGQSNNQIRHKNEFIEGVEIPRFSNSLTVDN